MDGSKCCIRIYMIKGWGVAKGQKAVGLEQKAGSAGG